MIMPQYINRFLKQRRAPSRQDPERDWVALISVAAVTLAGIVVWNIWAFGTAVNDGVIGAPSQATPSLVNQAILSDVRAVFTSRAAEEQNYVAGAYQYADPSQ